MRLKKLKIIWLKNGYPLKVIEKLVSKFFNKLFIPKKVFHTVPRMQLFISLNYLGQQSLFIKKRWEKMVKEQLPFCKINIVFSSKNRLGNSFTYKDKIPQNLKSLVLYKFSCRNCNISYIGKSIRHFQIRYSEHLGISFLTNKPYTFKSNTATTVREHIHSQNHDCSSDCFKIIGYAKNDYHLEIK